MDLPKHIISALLFLIAFQLPAQDLFINEVLADNEHGIEDFEGERVDWFEIYNASSQSVALGDYWVSDDLAELDKYHLPPVILSAGEFQLIYASGKDTIFPNGEIHVNFKVGRSGEALFLSGGDNEIIDESTDEAIHSDLSMVRIPDGGDWYFTSLPSPGMTNNNIGSIYNSHESGFYNETFELSLLSGRTSDSIYYTMDGSEPNRQSLLYSGPLAINDRSAEANSFSAIRTTPSWGPLYLDDFIFSEPDEPVFKSNVINYRSYSGGEGSPVYRKNYFVHENMQQRFTLPVLSISTDGDHLFDYYTGIYVPGQRFQDDPWNTYWPQGNYSNTGFEWERPVHVIYFEPDGKFGFETDAGIRMHGGTGGLAMPQKSIRLYFRSEYGLSEIDYNLFPGSGNDEFKRLILRNSGQEFNQTHFRDGVLQSLLEDLDIEIQNYQPAVVLINGEYWGIHNIRERYDKHYFKRHFDVDEEDLIIAGVCGEPEHGSDALYNELISFVTGNDLSIAANYAWVAGRVNVGNFIDYMIAQIYFANHDWPCNNTRMWRTTDADSKWRWLMFDLDASFNFNEFSSPDFNSIAHVTATGVSGWPNCDCSTVLFRRMLENTQFRDQFLMTFTGHMNTIFRPWKVWEAISDFKEEYLPEMQEHIDRWSYPASLSDWELAIGDMRQFAVERPCYMEMMLRNYFGESVINFDCALVNTDADEMPLMSVYPNPAKDRLQIELSGVKEGKFILTDVYGRIVRMERSSNTSIQEIDVSDLPAGMYLLVVNAEGLQSARQVVVVR